MTTKTRDELALGVINPKTGKREKGYITMLRVMKQNREKLVSGEISEEDLLERAFTMADDEIARREARPGEDPVTLDAADAAYAAAQEERYRREYGWEESNANDDAALTNLIHFEVEIRRLKRNLDKAGIPLDEKVEALKELRLLAKAHTDLQKSLVIDRTTRDNQRRTADPMAVLKQQIEEGAALIQSYIESAPVAFAAVENEASLRMMLKHHLGLPYAIIDSLLAEHRRVLKLPMEIEKD